MSQHVTGTLYVHVADISFRIPLPAAPSRRTRLATSLTNTPTPPADRITLPSNESTPLGALPQRQERQERLNIPNCNSSSTTSNSLDIPSSSSGSGGVSSSDKGAVPHCRGDVSSSTTCSSSREPADQRDDVALTQFDPLRLSLSFRGRDAEVAPLRWQTVQLSPSSGSTPTPAGAASISSTSNTSTTTTTTSNSSISNGSVGMVVHVGGEGRQQQVEEVMEQDHDGEGDAASPAGSPLCKDLQLPVNAFFAYADCSLLVDPAQAVPVGEDAWLLDLQRACVEERKLATATAGGALADGLDLDPRVLQEGSGDSSASRGGGVLFERPHPSWTTQAGADDDSVLTITVQADPGATRLRGASGLSANNNKKKKEHGRGHRQGRRADTAMTRRRRGSDEMKNASGGGAVAKLLRRLRIFHAPESSAPEMQQPRAAPHDVSPPSAANIVSDDDEGGHHHHHRRNCHGDGDAAAARDASPPCVFLCDKYIATSHLRLDRLFSGSPTSQHRSEQNQEEQRQRGSPQSSLSPEACDILAEAAHPPWAHLGEATAAAVAAQRHSPPATAATMPVSSNAPSSSSTQQRQQQEQEQLDGRSCGDNSSSGEGGFDLNSAGDVLAAISNSDDDRDGGSSSSSSGVGAAVPRQFIRHLGLPVAVGQGVSATVRVSIIFRPGKGPEPF